MITMKDLLKEAREVSLEDAVDYEVRRQRVRRLMDDAEFPALLSLVLEFEEDLAGSVSNYDRTPEERTLDAGGLATMRKFRAVIEEVLVVVEEEKKK